MKPWHLILISAFALLAGACLVWGLGSPKEETVCQIGTNKAIVDIPIMSKRIDRLEARIRALEEKCLIE
jgi:hypothetical protein